MKRSFLRELGIDAEIIDKIMAENGKDIEKYKSEIEDYVSEIKELKSKNVDMDKAIADAVKEKEAEFESKLAEKDKVIKETEDKVKDFDKISEELNGLKQANVDREYTEAINNFFTESKVDFTSNFAKEAILNKFKEKKFELKEGKFGKDASKFIDELKANQPVPNYINIRTFPASINVKFSVSIHNYNNIIPSMFDATLDYNDIVASKISKSTQSVRISYKGETYITNLTSTPREVEYVIETKD